MHLALRPYVTTGVALVGASVIAASPIAPVTPAEVQIPNPAVQAVERGVQLTANEIQTAVNNAIFNFVAKPTVQGAQLLGQLLAPLIGEEQAAALPLAALGFAGPLISGGGSVGTALQAIVDSDSFEEVLVNLIGAVGTVIDGICQRRLRTRSVSLGRGITGRSRPAVRRRPVGPSVQRATASHHPVRGACQPRRARC